MTWLTGLAGYAALLLAVLALGRAAARGDRMADLGTCAECGELTLHRDLWCSVACQAAWLGDAQ